MAIQNIPTKCRSALCACAETVTVRLRYACLTYLFSLQGNIATAAIQKKWSLLFVSLTSYEFYLLISANINIIGLLRCIVAMGCGNPACVLQFNPGAVPLCWLQQFIKNSCHHIWSGGRAEYQIRGTIHKIVSNLLTTQFLGGFLVNKKQGFEMKKKLLIAAAIAALPYTASAIISATDANLGQPCWTDGDGAGYRLVKCNMPKNVIDSIYAMTCSSTYAKTEADECFISGGLAFGGTGLGCVTGVTTNAFYLCSIEAGIGKSPLCDEAVATVWNTTPDSEKYFESESGTNRSYFDMYSCDTSGTDGSYVYDLTCQPVKEYRCERGYYHSSGAQFTNGYKCSQCPTPGTSPSDNNGDITTCYLSSGASFSDETGTYKCMANAYWKN